jgi:hypothetical protein
VVVEEFHATIFHTDSVGEDDAVSSTCDNNVVLFTPSDTLDFPGVTGESHAGWVLTCVEFEEME